MLINLLTCFSLSLNEISYTMELNDNFFVINDTIYEYNITNELHVFEINLSLTNLIIIVNSSEVRNNIVLNIKSKSHVQVDVFMNVYLKFEQSRKIKINCDSVLQLNDIGKKHEISYFSITAPFISYFPKRKTTKNYCFCTKSQIEKNIKNNDCSEVPIENYFHSQKDIYDDIINGPETKINIYLPENEFSEYKFRFYSSKVSLPNCKYINFIPTSKYFDIKLFVIFQLNNNYDENNSLYLSFHDISYLKFENNLFEDYMDLGLMNVKSVELKNAKLNIDYKSVLTIPSITSDYCSLSNVFGELQISNFLHLIKSSLSEINHIKLLDNSSLHISQISLFSEIYFSKESILFMNNDEIEVRFYIKENKKANIFLDEDGSSMQSGIKISNSEIQSYESKITFDITKLLIDFSNCITTNSNISFNLISSKKIYDKQVFLILLDTVPVLNISGDFTLILSSVKTLKLLMESSAIINVSKAVICSDIDLYIIFKAYHSIVLNDFEFDSNIFDSLSIDFYGKNIFLSSHVNSFSQYYFILQNDCIVHFDSTFLDILTLSNLYFENKNDIVFKTLNDVVPKVSINNIIGVLYEAKLNNIYISNSTNFENSNFNTGDNLHVICSNEKIFFPQDAFLSKTITFNLEAETKLCIIYKLKSRSSYVLNHGTFIIIPENSSIKSFDFEVLNLYQTQIVGSNNISLEVNYLYSDLILIDEYNTFPMILINRLYSLTNNDINLIHLCNNTIYISESSTGKQKLHKKEEASYYINTGSNSIYLSAEKAVPNHFTLNLTFSGHVDIHLDASWFKVKIPNDFKIITMSSLLKISSNLYELPNITIFNSRYENFLNYSLSLKEPVYTQKLAFWILFSIIILFFIFSLFICLSDADKVESSSIADISSANSISDFNSSESLFVLEDSDKKKANKRFTNDIDIEKSESFDSVFARENNDDYYNFICSISDEDISSVKMKKKRKVKKRNRKEKKDE